MNIIHTQTAKVARTGRVSVAGRLAGAAAALSLGAPILATLTAAPASADTKYTPVVNQDYSIDCTGECRDRPLTVPFTTTGSSIRVTLTSPGTGTCKHGLAEVSIDGQYQSTRRVGPGWEQEPFTKDLAAGNHTVTVMFMTLSDCYPNPGQAEGIKGHLQVDDVVADQAPKPETQGMMATVLRATDYYAKPGGGEEEQPLGAFTQGQSGIHMIGCQRVKNPRTANDNWCSVYFGDPAQFVYVWGDDVSGPGHPGKP